MSLPPGTRLGPYEVVGLLGAGGMGEVYRARDTRLQRDVAVKVLPSLPESGSNPQSSQSRRARFQREAQALAQLNHPNVASVYGVEESSGIEAIVMELVPGPTLADRIGRGPLPLTEALAIARQLALACEAAHSKGIVHRDLKPANIKLRSDGTVKVLDFGLAKFVSPNGVDEAASLVDGGTSDVTTIATMPSTVLGTPAYMAPEQARGQSTDKRVDTWAFGVIVFEMLTGRSLFGRSSVAETMAATLGTEPDYEQLPPSVRRLCRSCLQKDPDRRLRDIGDAHLLLEGDVVEAGPLRARRSHLAWAAAALMTAVAGLALWAPWRVSPTVPEPVRFQIAPQGTLARSSGLAISPDGRQFAYIAAGRDGTERVWVHDMHSLVDRALPDSNVGQAATPPFWSPDSRYIAFDAGGRLRKIDVTGGLAETITDLQRPAVGGTWSRDGVILFSGLEGGILRVPDTGGPAEPVTVVNRERGETAHLTPVFLPDGRHFLYLLVSRNTPERSGIFVGSIDAPPEKQDQRRILATPTSIRYVSGTGGTGTMLFAREGRLMAQSFDERRQEMTGSAVLVAEDVDAYRDGITVSVSSTGVLVYLSTATLELRWFDRNGRLVSSAEERGQFLALSLSPDGTRAIVSSANPQVVSRRELFLFDFRRPAIRLSSAGDDPVWSPDGQQFIYDAEDGLYQRNVDGPTPRRLVAMETSARQSATSWSPDGRFLLHTLNSPKTGSDIWTISLSQTPTVAPFLQTEAGENQAQFSPATGEPLTVAYTSNETGRNEVYVRPFSGSSSSQMVSRGGGHSSRWRGDGRELYYISADGAVMAVPMAPSGPGQPTQLFSAPSGFGSRDSTGSRSHAPWGVTPDGQRFLFATPAEENASRFTVVLNWQTGLN